VPTPPQVIGAWRRPTGEPSMLHALAVRFHLELLEIGGEQPQPLVIGEDRAGLGAAHVGVIAVGEGGEDRRVALQRREAEVAVHRRGAFQQLLERAQPSASAAGKPIEDQSE
jgi:hypothetical protein